MHASALRQEIAVVADMVWKVTISGIVSRRVDGVRFQVNEGDWTMRRTPSGAYRLTCLFDDPFEISQSEAETYIRAKAIKIIEGTWP
jgi:hypothetical protein